MCSLTTSESDLIIKGVGRTLNAAMLGEYAGIESTIESEWENREIVIFWLVKYEAGFF